MNTKGFTLFTALVSFVLIALAFVLIQSMIESERSSSQTIETIDEQTEMQNIADLARADAIQVFNVGVRYQFELWITDRQNEFYVLDTAKFNSSSSQNWQGMIDDFAAAELGSKEYTDPVTGRTVAGSEQLANRIANHLTATLSTGSNLNTYTFKGYDVGLQINDDPANPNDSSKMKNILKVVINNGVDSQKLLEPIECNESSCNLGTFYINLDLTRISFEQYSQLPQIVVRSHATGRVIKQPILPKGNIRVFVPLRIFKAMWKAMKITGNVQRFGNTVKSQGLGLGMCDSDCSVRTSPKAGKTVSIDKDHFPPNGKLCPNTQGQGEPYALTEIKPCDPPEDCPTKGLYLPNNNNDMGTVLREFISRMGIQEFNSIDPDLDDGLPLWNGGNAPVGNIINGTTKSIAAKKIQLYTGGNYYPQQVEGTAYCVKPSGLEVILEFTETKNEFKVNKKRPNDVYKIKIVENYNVQEGTPSACKSVRTPGAQMSETYSCEQ